jgi:dTDP-4-dehydrorhamnose reductase
VTSWLVTGAAGQVGSEVVALLRASRPGDDVVALARRDLDIADRGAVQVAVAHHGPDVVVNCAAYTAVDDAESDEAAATRINGDAPGFLATACADIGARLIHVSTDYVFDGTASEPIAVDAPVSPRSAYGRSKAAGERAVLGVNGVMYVVRTAWVYGAVGGNFVKTIARLAGSRDRLDVVDDQHGSPTWSAELARGLVALGAAPAEQCPPGIWHLTGAGATTWCGFARAIVAELGLDPAMVHPTTTAEFPRPAPRPVWSVLSNAKWLAHGLPPMRSWEAALTDALPTMGLMRWTA